MADVSSAPLGSTARKHPARFRLVGGFVDPGGRAVQASASGPGSAPALQGRCPPLKASACWPASGSGCPGHCRRRSRQRGVGHLGGGRRFGEPVWVAACLSHHFQATGRRPPEALRTARPARRPARARRSCLRASFADLLRETCPRRAAMAATRGPPPPRAGPVAATACSIRGFEYSAAWRAAFMVRTAASCWRDRPSAVRGCVPAPDVGEVGAVLDTRLLRCLQDLRAEHDAGVVRVLGGPVLGLPFRRRAPPLPRRAARCPFAEPVAALRTLSMQVTGSSSSVAYTGISPFHPFADHACQKRQCGGRLVGLSKDQ